MPFGHLLDVLPEAVLVDRSLIKVPCLAALDPTEFPAPCAELTRLPLSTARAFLATVQDINSRRLCRCGAPRHLCQRPVWTQVAIKAERSVSSGRFPAFAVPRLNSGFISKLLLHL